MAEKVPEMLWLHYTLVAVYWSLFSVCCVLLMTWFFQGGELRIGSAKQTKCVTAFFGMFFIGVAVGGFGFGFVNCADCGGNVFACAMIGLIFAVLTLLFGGYPPQNAAAVGPPYNVWPYIVPVWVVIFAIGLAILWLQTRSSEKD